MKSLTFFNLLWALTARECLAGIIIETKKLDEPSIVEAAVKLYENCYDNRVQTVGIAGSSTEIVSSFDKPTAVILINDASRATTTSDPRKRDSRYKLQNFVVTSSSIPRLEQTLKNLKLSLWWNHMATFLIVDEVLNHGQGCSNAYEILSTTWKMNLLRAKLICHDEYKRPLIYSYNPFTNQAPIPWQVEKTYRRTNKHPWTLLVRGYQDSQEICKDLDFDQTKNLGGYEIQASVRPTDINKNSSKTNLECVTGFTGKIARYTFRALNSTSKIFTSESTDKLFGMIFSGYTEIFLSAWYQQNDFNSPMTYPHLRSGLTSITQHRGNLSQIEKLLRVIDRSSRYAVIVVCFINFVFFKFFFRQSVTSAILNMVRLICNTAVPNLPITVAMRIYLSGLFIFLVTLQGIYQGQLASLLTKPVALQNVKTFQDLENFKYTIYGHKGFTFYFKKLNFSGPIVPIEDFDCVTSVLKDDAAACVDDKRFLVSKANRYDLHMSDTIIPMFVAYFIREDWPLETRFNTLISRLVETNIIGYVFMKDVEPILRKQKFYEKEKENQSFTVIALEDLAFAFAVLGIGLASATVVFFVEVWKGRK